MADQDVPAGDDAGVDQDWDEVESLLESLQFDASVEAEKLPTDTLRGWLAQYQLEQYHDLLVEHGFDDLYYLTEEIMSEQDLRRLGVRSQDDCSTLVAVASLLPCRNGLDEPETLEQWLQAIHLEEYKELLLEKGHSTIKKVCALWEKDLQELGIAKLGHRRRLMSSIRELHMLNPMLRGEVQLPEMSDEELLLRMRRLSLSRLVELSRESSAPTMPATNLHRDFSTVQAKMKRKPAPVAPQRVKLDTNETRGSADPNDPNFDASRPQNDRDLDPLNLRAPRHAQEHNIKLLQKMGIEGTQLSKMGDTWKHQVTEVLKGNIHYQVQYLGTDLVKKFEGPKTTQEACTKMKLMASKMQKVPRISLWVHGSIIKFVDSKSQNVIRKDELKTVLYIAQDTQDPTVFGYIARDVQQKKLCFCHVLKAETKKEANEVVMTLGQAFEIAYQNHKKVKAIAKMAAFEKDLEKKGESASATDSSGPADGASAGATATDSATDTAPGSGGAYAKVIPRRVRKSVRDGSTSSLVLHDSQVKIIDSPQLLTGRGNVTHTMSLYDTSDAKDDKSPNWVSSGLEPESNGGKDEKWVTSELASETTGNSIFYDGPPKPRRSKKSD